MNQAANGIITSCDVLADLLESIENFVNRISVHTQLPHTLTMDEVLAKLIVELIFTLAQVTRRLNKRRSPFLADVYLTQHDAVIQGISSGSRTSRPGRASKDWTDSYKKKLRLTQLRFLRSSKINRRM